jgi:glutaminyl-peptide cyclotransferase
MDQSPARQRGQVHVFGQAFAGKIRTLTEKWTSPRNINEIMKSKPTASAARHSNKAIFVAAMLAFVAALAGWAWVHFNNRSADDEVAAAFSTMKLEDIPFDGAQAYKYLKDLCAIGPRRSGSEGMAAQQKLLIEHFKKAGGDVVLQRFRARDPRDGAWVPMTNILVRWNPKATERILLCAHYDTLPFPMHDPVNPEGVFIGANDNASGVAILMQLAHDMPKLGTKYGVDFLLLDGEEYIFDRRDRFFLGSEYFAREYAKGKTRYHWGVLLDMVGNTDLRLLQERSGLIWKDTRPLVQEIWATAARLGVREFVARPMKEVDFMDDHVVLHEIGSIPCIDIIDFDYAPWHTEADTPDKCSALSLAKVGWVMEEWLKTAK